ncbi:hypothetical protein IB275_13610 [Pseudomonas sp. PDM21]|uniref:hypothetical protein n=1 Tax=Pseudomonas sp. PDM21 TaxID=2769257 RepID=UPI00177B56AF|nr:hypothetical protein [Pseudomonas sp. PDM21]MBD9671614.1 hypothetical protein [Pseudomonas sp. PDM21]
MSWIILVDARSNNGHYMNIEDSDGNIAQFESEESAREVMSDHPLSAFPCYAISVDDDEIAYL